MILERLEWKWCRLSKLQSSLPGNGTNIPARFNARLSGIRIVTDDRLSAKNCSVVQLQYSLLSKVLAYDQRSQAERYSKVRQN
jgi:hypothetical protein